VDESLEIDGWSVDYKSIIAAHLARKPNRVWSGHGFVIPMSMEEWRGFPRMPAWRYEYYAHCGAKTQIRPFGSSYRLTVEPKSIAVVCEIRSIQREDARALRQSFVAAFSGYVDYLYSNETQVGRLCVRLLRKFYSDSNYQLCRKASCLAIDPQDRTRLIGVALLALDPLCDSEDRLLLQPIFVAPDWQRRGVATALIAEVFRRLQQGSVEVLRSCCSDHDAASKRWHRAVGMTEKIGFFARRSVFNWLCHEFQRRRFLSEREGIAFELEERLQLEAWLTSLATELDRLREEELDSKAARIEPDSFSAEADQFVKLGTID